MDPGSFQVLSCAVQRASGSMNTKQAISMPSIRISICRNSGKQRGKVQGVAVVPQPLTFDAIAKAVQGKLKLKKRELIAMRVFALESASGVQAGTEILNTPETLALLENGMVLSISVGESFIRPDGYRGATASDMDAWVPRPPCYPWPKGTELGIDDEELAAVLNDHLGDVGSSSGGSDEGNEGSALSTSAAAGEVLPAASMLNDMHGPFPVLDGNILPRVRAAVAGCSAFVFKDRGSYLAVDYSTSGKLSDAFPDPIKAGKVGSKERWEASVRRECRGLLICRSSGKVVSRRFHKFWNVDELPESSSSEVHTRFVEAGENISVAAKIDGSLASPFLLPEGGVRWALRTTESEPIKLFVEARSALNGFKSLAEDVLTQGVTPLFEWCDTKGTVGVIRHESQSLTLLAARHMVDGSYFSRRQLEGLSEKHRVPLVAEQTFRVSAGVQGLVDEVSELVGHEGVVLQLGAGGCIGTFKLKSVWYVSLAAAAKAAGAQNGCGGGGGERGSSGGSGGGDMLQRYCRELLEVLTTRSTLHGVPRHLLWSGVISSLMGEGDDTFSMCKRSLQRDDASTGALEDFEEAVERGCERLTADFIAWAALVKRTSSMAADSASKKKLVNDAAALAVSAGWTAKIVTSCLKAESDTSDVSVEVGNVLAKLIKNNRWEALKRITDVEWDEEKCCAIVFKDHLDLGEEVSEPALDQFEVTDIGDFSKASFDLREHVVGTYLRQKIANYLGMKPTEIKESTLVHIPREYSPEEGKLKGMHDNFQKEGVLDLRIDLQPKRKEGSEDDHYGSIDFANLAVQFGANDKCENSSKGTGKLSGKGAFAGIFVKTGTDHAFSDLSEAMQMSFETGKYIRLQAHPMMTAATLAPLATPAAVLPRVFVDLDDTLANFTRSFVKRFSLLPSEVETKVLWQKIESTRNFFAELEWVDGAKALWGFLQSCAADGVCEAPVILTGLPSGKFGKTAAKAKRAWVRAHLGDDVEVITCMSSEKSRWSSLGDIMVDDRLALAASWEAKGGKFVHFTSPSCALWKLRSLIYPTSYNREHILASKTLMAADGGKSSLLPCFESPSFVWLGSAASDALELLAVEEQFYQMAAIARIVAIDCEWRPDDTMPQPRYGKKSAAALIQVAFDETSPVYLIDMMSPSAKTARALEVLLGPGSSVLKLCFGTEDFERLPLRLPQGIGPFVDVQQALLELTPLGTQPTSLDMASRVFLGRSMTKSKALQAFDWETRPLGHDFLAYAAGDAAILLLLFKKLQSLPVLESALASMSKTNEPFSARERSKLVYSSRGNATNGSQRLLAAEFKGLQPLAENSVELLAIFLQPASRSILLDALAPRHAHVLAEHITLSFRPSGDVLHEAAPIVGQPVAIKINLSACLRSNRVDAVPVVISDEVIRRFVVSGSPHLTLSKIPQADASESLGLLKEALFSQEPPSFLELTGIVGLQCASGSLGNATPSLVSLGSKTREIVEELVANGQPGQTLKLKGLSGAERMIIHEYAAHVGISHESEGQKKQGGGKKKGREGVKKKDSEATSDGGRVLMLKLPAGWSGVELDLGYDSTPRGENSRIFSSANEIDRPANSKNSIGQEQKTSQVIYNLDHFDSGSSCGDGDCGVGGVERSAHGQILEGGRVLWFSKEAPTLPSQCLRRAIMGEHDKERRLVVILRGIPGSGKSTFASQMASEWGAKVSADEYFERGAGVLSKRQLKEMSASEVYAACFDVKKLEEAHEYCKEQFVKMVVQRASPIVVDNSNVKKSEYAFYTNCAKESGYAVLVVEVSDTLGEQKTFGAHQAPWPVITKMRKSWETDEDAIKLIGWCAKTTPLGGKTEALAAGGRRLTHWLGEHKGAVHTIKERKKTHLSMEAAGNRVHFLNVPEHLLTEFYEACACDSSPRYLCEVVDASENFRMFLDVDLPREDSSANDFEWIQRVVNAIPTALAACGVGDGGGGGERSEWGEAIVVGAQRGFHVKLPRVEVSRNEALAVREALVRTLVASSSGAASAKGVLPPDWAGVIDESVYTHLTCRMLGSRKATKGRDVGRVYSLKAVFDLNDAAHASGAGVSSIQRLSEVEEMYHQNMAGLLAKCSIRIPALARAGAAEGEAGEGRL